MCRSRYEDAVTRQHFAARVRPSTNIRNLSDAAPRQIPASSAVDKDSNMLDPTPRIPNTIISNAVAANTTLRAKTLREQQAVLSLQALAQQDESSEKVLGNQIADLTNKLILGAGEDVLGLAEREEREQLEVFQKLIMRRLSILHGSGDGAVKSERSSGRERIVVNGAGNGSGNASASGSPRGISKSKSKSRERRGVSRGRK